jgi:hypothetical protein
VALLAQGADDFGGVLFCFRHRYLLGGRVN